MQTAGLVDIQSSLESIKEKYSEFRSEQTRKEQEAWEKSQKSSKSRISSGDDQKETGNLSKLKKLLTLADMSGGRSNSTKNLPQYSFDSNVLYHLAPRPTVYNSTAGAKHVATMKSPQIKEEVEKESCSENSLKTDLGIVNEENENGVIFETNSVSMQT